MVTFPLPVSSGPRAKIVRIPTREELRAMLNDRAVAITAMILAFLLAVATLGTVVFLAWKNTDSAVINTLITALTMAIGGALGARWRAQGTKGADDA